MPSIPGHRAGYSVLGTPATTRETPSDTDPGGSLAQEEGLHKTRVDVTDWRVTACMPCCEVGSFISEKDD